MTDYISREAFAAEMKERQTEAGKWLRDAKDHDTAVRADAVLSFLCEVKLTLDKLPAADVRPVKWIPVTERLPETYGEYMVAYHPCYWDSVRDEIKVGLDSFRGKTSWAKKKYQRVTHWMPLPEPPKEET